VLRRSVNFREAERYLASRADKPTALKAKEYLTVWDAETRRKSFFSARVASADLLSALHAKVQAVVEGKGTENQAAELLRVFLERDGAEALSALGFLPAAATTDALTELSATRRLRLILYQNAKIAEEAGAYQQWAVNKDMFPYGRWRLGYAEEHREEHVARDGKIYPFDHPIWTQSPPGSEFNCHCYREELTAEEARAAGVPIEPIPKDPLPRPTVDFDPSQPLASPPPIKPEVPPAIRDALLRQLTQPGQA